MLSKIWMAITKHSLPQHSSHLEILPNFLWRYIESTYLPPRDAAKLLAGCKSFNKLFTRQYYHNRFVQTRSFPITIVIRNATRDNNIIDNVYLWIDALSSVSGCESLSRMFNFMRDSTNGMRDYIIIIAGGVYQGGSMYSNIKPGYELTFSLTSCISDKEYNYKIIGSDDVSNPTIIKLGYPESPSDNINYIEFAIPTSFSMSNITFVNTQCKIRKFAMTSCTQFNTSVLNCAINNCIFINSETSISGADKCIITHSKFYDSQLEFHNHAVYIPVKSPIITLDCVISDCIFETKSNACFCFTGSFDGNFISPSVLYICNNIIINTLSKRVSRTEVPDTGDANLAVLILDYTYSFPNIWLTNNSFANMALLSKHKERHNNIALDDSNRFDNCGSGITDYTVYTSNIHDCIIA